MEQEIEIGEITIPKPHGSIKGHWQMNIDPDENLTIKWIEHEPFFLGGCV